ncbi:helix-turn-helix transcriptional regulator [Microbacterium sp. MPKO10]|uniref:helix-turn-helix transcriptional regulator n=1 Tax=Microbacterium sp. MPKO10 TaxID=2989818 RepID=UPI0022367B39|nr:helix-turn-helix transcriptional regulator [Microbacterium sp. MPKO10]MCW4457504.1 helix-turn-helix transcriptional regulator [Microbacterium sp. MPKO10]
MNGESQKALGAFLRARRELVTPEQVGIPKWGGRRVPGLRREEVALLAGISADYYLRLERGRDRNPSAQVLHSIARVLQLDDEHIAHLFSLVADAPRQQLPPAETPPSGALKLLGALTQPAFIENRSFDVLASNPLMRVVDPRLTVGRNQLRDLFLDPASQALYPEWENVTECLVSNLRQAVGREVDDPHVAALTTKLSDSSSRFRQLWARHEVRGQSSSTLLLNHPQVGDLSLNRERLSINGAPGLMLVVFHPDAASRSAEKMSRLSSTSIPATPTVREVADSHRSPVRS